MEAAQRLIQAVASILWPIIVIVLFLCFRPAIVSIIESAKSRKFTLKIAGQELTIEEASQTQQNLITDLQHQVSEIRKQLDKSVPERQPHSNSRELVHSKPTRILWVDDNPKNNAYFVQQLARQGITTDLAVSTSEGLALFDTHHYDFVISDMGRQEGRTYDPSAGVTFLEQIRQRDEKVEVVIFCSSQAEQKFGAKARALGASFITSSPTELYGILMP